MPRAWNFIDRVGHVYGRLTVIEFAGKGKYNTQWKCRCECGNETTVVTSNLISENTTSCGCYHREIGPPSKRKHGMDGTTEYQTWSNMKARCYNEKHISYDRYGGRGIKVCDRWLEGFENFFEDMGLKPAKKYSIDRVDVNGNYSPENCRWATSQEQANNKSTNVYLSFYGRMVTKSQAIRIMGKKRYSQYHWNEFLRSATTG